MIGPAVWRDPVYDELRRPPPAEEPMVKDGNAGTIRP
jgi:hypothetical protein